MQLVTELYLYNSTYFNRIEVSRLDSTLSVFIIIFIHILYHGVRLVIRIQTAFKTIQTPGFRMQRGFYSDPNSLAQHFKVEIFRLLPRPFPTTQHIGDIRREFILWTLKADLDQLHNRAEYNRYKKTLII